VHEKGALYEAGEPDRCFSAGCRVHVVVLLQRQAYLLRNVQRNRSGRDRGQGGRNHHGSDAWAGR
jgi:hypothetical protein